MNIQLCKWTGLESNLYFNRIAPLVKRGNEYLTEPAKLDLGESSFFYVSFVSCSNTHSSEGRNTEMLIFHVSLSEN